MKIAADHHMVKTNRFLTTILSGSKGSIFNIAQITSLLGQQNVNGSRIVPLLHGDRSLIYYEKQKQRRRPLSPDNDINIDVLYEKRGFIRNSFIKGLNPCEYFFHAMSGREGVIDTSLKTSHSGYSQRKIIKVCEDLKIQYDGTVRNVNNEVIQLYYSHSGLSPKCVTYITDKDNKKWESFININMLG